MSEARPIRASSTRPARRSIGFALFYTLPIYARLPRTFYDPVARRWFFAANSTPIPMGYVGQIVWGIAGALVAAAAIAMMLTSRTKSAPSGARVRARRRVDADRDRDRARLLHLEQLAVARVALENCKRANRPFAATKRLRSGRSARRMLRN